MSSPPLPFKYLGPHTRRRRRYNSPETETLSLQHPRYLRPHKRPRQHPKSIKFSPPEDLVQEILKWVPVKSLMRFKCVSRLWRSIILDRRFAKEYRGGFRGLLITGQLLRYSAGQEQERETIFYHASLQDVCSKQISYHRRVNHGRVRMRSTRAVNGLVCFYHGNRSSLHNVATGESLQLPVSAYESLACTYHLGFDPAEKSYKLLKICPIYRGSLDYRCFEPRLDCADFRGNLNCEILTFGEGVKGSNHQLLRWRSLAAPPPPWEIASRSVCYHGVLYWLEPIERSESESHLIAFNLSTEDFSVIPTMTHWTLASAFGPGLALITAGTGADTDGECARIYEIVQMMCYNNKNGNDGPLVPTEVRFEYDAPPPPREDGMSEEFLFPHGIFPDGKILIFNQNFSRIPFPAVFYLYDPATKHLEKVVIPKVDAIPPLSSASAFSIPYPYLSYHEDNIIPLKFLVSHT